MKPVRVSMDDGLPDVASSISAKVKEYWPKEDRYKFIFCLFLAVSLIDITRIALSLCVVEVAKDLEWNKLETGLVLSAFFWGYFATQLPAGFLSDTYGGDVVLMWSLLGSALSTLAIPVITSQMLTLYFAPSILVVLFVRVFLGFSQGLFFPSLLSLLGRKLPTSERSMGNSFISSGGALGSLFIGSVGSLMLIHFGWRWVFLSFGFLGLLWVVIWKEFFLFRRRTIEEDMYRMSKKFESKTNRSRSYTPRNAIIPWGKLVRQPAIWAIIIVHFSQNCMYLNLSSWLPTYFHENFPDAKGWIFNVLPYVFNFSGKIIGGKCADKMLNMGYSLTFVRKFFETLATAGAGLIMLLCSYATEFWQALACVSLAFGLSSLTTSGAICNIQDLSPNFSGSISGMVFTITSIPGIIGVYFTGYILHATESWHVVFQLTAVICIVGNTVYIIFGSSKRIA
ncbi:solute carrier family 17 member 9-like [Actinia tenebrosa]|uniref:Solute carrier family 17 member 9-like n=1 Tax=Actinia tenebrosa TaxID=6105 RepID=A0A6P8I6U9_ACTTE|nr:solute carrier family 17 member 9-like [Actinia tenebrosa]